MVKYDSFYQRKQIERRRGPDVWIRSLTWLAVSGWILMFFALILAGLAKPESKTVYDHFFSVSRTFRNYWDDRLVRYIYYIMSAGIFISTVGLLINRKRHRRKYDQYRISLILLGIISLMFLVFLMGVL